MAILVPVLISVVLVLGALALGTGALASRRDEFPDRRQGSSTHWEAPAPPGDDCDDIAPRFPEDVPDDYPDW